MPLILSTPIDMSAKWKGLCKGGGRGIHTYFCCHCDATTSNDCAKPNENLCDRCAARHSVPSDTHSTSDDSDSSDTSNNDLSRSSNSSEESSSESDSESDTEILTDEFDSDDEEWDEPLPELGDDIPWQCHHHKMLLPDAVHDLEVRVTELSDQLSIEAGRIPPESSMKIMSLNDPDRETTPTSIDFQWRNSDERKKFLKLVTNELSMRDVNQQGVDLADRINNLRDIILMAESEVRRLLLSLEHAREKPNAFLDLLKSVPCILHLENRVAIKILTVLLIHGLSLSDRGKLKAPAFANTSKLRMQHFVGAVEEVTNTKLLGSHVNPTQWVFPIDTSDKDQPMKVGTIYLSNTRSKKNYEWTRTVN
jgi:hypothetical protein